MTRRRLPHIYPEGRCLFSACSGPRFLVRDEIAAVVDHELHYGEQEGRHEIGAYVIMSNHVHALLLPKTPASKLMRLLKSFSAREANRLLDRTGEPFWQRAYRE
jgi:REP element-mobilizing transposase RayT